MRRWHLARYDMNSWMDDTLSDGAFVLFDDHSVAMATKDDEIARLRELWKDACKLTVARRDDRDRLLKALDKLSRWNEPDSVIGGGEYDSGLLCGVEDRGLQKNGYEAMRYGYNQALQRVSEEIDGTIADALFHTPDPERNPGVAEPLRGIVNSLGVDKPVLVRPCGIAPLGTDPARAVDLRNGADD